MTNLNKYIDHTLLKAEATPSDIELLCSQAKEYNFYSVCVNPFYVTKAKTLLQQTDVKVCSVIDFPLGASGINNKSSQAECAIRDGADELDMVIPIGMARSDRYGVVADHINAVLESSRNKPVKVIIETALLTTDQKIELCKIVSKSGAAFIKTSTGFQSGADLLDIALFKKYLDPKIKIKASGGIKTSKQAIEFINAGADRLGTSSSVDIILGANK